jgi:uncharacterized protein YgiM (DUF1202 family)
MPRRGLQSQDVRQPPFWRVLDMVLPAVLVGAAAVGWVVVFSPRQPASSASVPSRPVMTRAVPTQAPTLWGTAAYPTETPGTRGTALATFTGTPPGVMTPTAGTGVDTGGLEVGGSAVVAGTGTSGLNMRSEASVSSQHILTLREGTVVELVDGPLRDNQYVWWKVRDESGTSGWVVAEYLTVQ